MAILIPTAYLPPACYMAEALHADKIVLEAFETYSKQTIRNHCVIFGPNGRQILSIPIVKPNGNHTLTKDVIISTHQPWQKIHWRSIETAYSNSPFFLFYQDMFLRFYEKQFKFLFDLNTEILQLLLKTLKSGISVTQTEKFEKSPASVKDLRTILGTKNHPLELSYPHYTQVFETRHGFLPGLSILDVIFNLGPEASSYLKSIG